MKVSLNTIKRFTPVDLPLDELVTRINKQLGKVEGTKNLSARYDGAVIVRIDSCTKHQNADKLNVCMIDDGSGELTQVVCGAPNVREGMYVVWLKPGSTVPSTADDVEPFVLGARELRGVMSNGMLASPKELGLGDSHDGILEINPNEKSLSSKQIVAGDSFARAYGLDDVTIDIENKMFTHRPDLFGQLGIAREIAGIQQQQFSSPEWYNENRSGVADVGTSALPLDVFNDAVEKVPRFMAITMTGVKIQPSPVWLQAELVRMGGKPINNVVDATNYIMLMTAQPTHAYDYAKLRGDRLGARMARDGETVTLLNGKSYELTPDDIVIADAEGPVGLGGVMGGGESEVSEATTNIVLEVANFDMYAVRKSSMRHGIFTDALTRFNKGQSPLQNAIVLRSLVELITQVADGTPASEVYDKHQLSGAVRDGVVTPAFINERLGLKLQKREIEQLLNNVEFDICKGCESDMHTGEAVHYMVPFWRTDIEAPEDVVEEVGRLYGFDRLPRELPRRTISTGLANPLIDTKQSVRQRLVRAGANELLTYSFVHEKLLSRAGQDATHAYRLSNALSPDLQYYRLSLLPSLIDKVHMNIKAGYEAFALFEIGKVHFKGEMDEREPTVPGESERVALVTTRRIMPNKAGGAYFDARRYLGEIVNLKTTLLTPLKEAIEKLDVADGQLVAAYDPERSAVILRGDKVFGVVGEFRSDIQKSFKLPLYSAGFEVHAELLTTGSKPYRPLSKFPSVTQDISIRAEGVPYAAVTEVVNEVAKANEDSLVIAADPIDIYQPHEGEPVTTTFRLTVTSYASTLTAGDVRPVVEMIDTAVNERFAGRVI